MKTEESRIENIGRQREKDDPLWTFVFFSVEKTTKLHSDTQQSRGLSVASCYFFIFLYVYTLER